MMVIVVIVMMMVMLIVMVCVCDGVCGVVVYVFDGVYV